MSGLILYDGKLLIRDGKLATSLDCCCGNVNCDVYLWTFQIEFDNDAGGSTAPNPVPNISEIYTHPTTPNRVAQLGFILNDCTDTAGVRVLTYWVVMCQNVQPDDNVVSTNIAQALAAYYNEDIALSNLGSSDYLGSIDDFIAAVNSAPYTDNPGPGECNGIEDSDYTPLDATDLECCQ